MDVERIMTRAGESLAVGRAFGEPVERDGTLIIPVAWVAGGGGGGGQDASDDLPSGSGGGFGGVVWPLGAYVVTGDRVRWVPAIDVTRLILGAFALAKIITKMRGLARARSSS
jgi:uncharacterized spore protein YtfJ